MLQVGGRPDLGQKTLGAEYGRELGAEQFQGNGAIVANISRQEDQCHAAGTEFTLDAVRALETSGESVDDGQRAPLQK